MRFFENMPVSRATQTLWYGVSVAAALCLPSAPTYAQHPVHHARATAKARLATQAHRPGSRPAQLQQYAPITPFLNGQFRGLYALGEMKQHGDFGLGAPNALDGELTMVQGRWYRTQATGVTTEMPDSARAPFTLVAFSRPTRTVRLSRTLTRPQLLHALDSLLPKPNSLYAVHVTGRFGLMQTRAFPAMKPPFKPLAQLMSQQHVFKLSQVTGDLVGFRLPSYLEGVSIPGYHFHFLSTARDAGGHMLDFTATNVTVAITELTSFALEVPQTVEFEKFTFPALQPNADLQLVEQGSKKP
jgi:acetolactate decarboxylase